MNRSAHHSALVLPILVLFLISPVGFSQAETFLDLPFMRDGLTFGDQAARLPEGLRFMNPEAYEQPVEPIPYDVLSVAMMDIEAMPGGDGDEVLPSPPPAPGGPSEGMPYYTRVKLPGPGFRVVAKYYDASCAAVGGLCQTVVYTAGADSCAYVPLMYGGPFVFYWWDKVRMEYPCITPWGWFDRSLMSPIELHPESQSGDRLAAITVSYPADEVLVLNTLRKIQSHSQSHFNWSRGSIEIRWALSASYSSNDYMNFPDLGQFFQRGPEAGLYAMIWTLAHEYFHGIQQLLFPTGPKCTHDTHNVWDLVSSDCADHDGCLTGQSYQGSTTEGFADAYADVLTDLLNSRPPGTNWPSVCWRRYPNNPDMKGDLRELNIRGYAYGMFVWNPLSAMNAYRYARITEVTGQTHAVTTHLQYRGAVNDINYEANRWLSQHSPAPNPNEQKLYDYNIWGEDTTTVVTGVETPGYPPFDEYKDLQWIKSIGQNPIVKSGTMSVRVVSPSSGAVRLSIYSVHGRSISSQTYSGLPPGESDLSFRLPYLPSGQYYLQLDDPKNHRAKDSVKFLYLR